MDVLRKTSQFLLGPYTIFLAKFNFSQNIDLIETYFLQNSFNKPFLN